MMYLHLKVHQISFSTSYDFSSNNILLNNGVYNFAVTNKSFTIKPEITTKVFFISAAGGAGGDGGYGSGGGGGQHSIVGLQLEKGQQYYINIGVSGEFGYGNTGVSEVGSIGGYTNINNALYLLGGRKTNTRYGRITYGMDPYTSFLDIPSTNDQTPLGGPDGGPGGNKDNNGSDAENGETGVSGLPDAPGFYNVIFLDPSSIYLSGGGAGSSTTFGGEAGISGEGGIISTTDQIGQTSNTFGAGGGAGATSYSGGIGTMGVLYFGWAEEEITPIDVSYTVLMNNYLDIELSANNVVEDQYYFEIESISSDVSINYQNVPVVLNSTQIFNDISYIPHLNYYGDSSFNFRPYFINGVASVTDGSVNVYVIPQIRPSINYVVQSNENTYEIDLSASVYEEYGQLNYYIQNTNDLSLNQSGTVLNDGDELTLGDSKITIGFTNVDGNFIYGDMSFNFYVKENGIATSDICSNLSIVNIRKLVELEDISLVTLEDTALNIDLNQLTQGAIPKGNTPYFFYVNTLPINGELEENGTRIITTPYFVSSEQVQYIPNNNYWGLDSFTAYAREYFDGVEYITNSATIDISINAVDDAPVAFSKIINVYAIDGENPGPQKFTLPQPYDVEDNSFNYIINSELDPSSGRIYDPSTNPLMPTNEVSGNEITFEWNGTHYGGSSFTYYVQEYGFDVSSGIPTNKRSNNAPIIIQIIFEGTNGCETGPGPDPPREWTREENNCIDRGIYTTDQLDERRKAEIFKYKKNSANFTSKEIYSRFSRGLGQQRGQTFATQTQLGSNPNTQNLQLAGENGPLLCNGSFKNFAYSSQNDVPGPNRKISYDPKVPLVNYKVNRTYGNGGGKWPQRGSQILVHLVNRRWNPLRRSRAL